MSHLIDPTTTQGNDQFVRVIDENSVQLLVEILKELKKMNMYFSLLTDIQIGNDDL